MALIGKQIAVTADEALEEIMRLMKEHKLRGVLSDKESLDAIIARIQAVLQFHKDTTAKTKKEKGNRGNQKTDS